jgi:pectinesterase inhibitor-like protein
LTKICGATRFQAECLATIAPYQTGAADPISVIEMGIQALHKDFQEAIATVTKLSKDTSLSATTRDSLDICVESYEAGITDLNDALTAISTHDTDRLTQMLGAIASYPETCQDAFLEQGEESPLKDVDQKLDMLASITVDITILLPGVKIIE